jgi:DNA-directed RNA polymerase specialized sigma24 family protein
VSRQFRQDQIGLDCLMVLASIDATRRQMALAGEVLLERAIALLKAEDRVLVHMFYYENRGLREIAPVLNATHDALKMRLSRARKRLRQILKDFKDE